jgi:hypothetical protein
MRLSLSQGVFAAVTMVYLAWIVGSAGLSALRARLVHLGGGGAASGAAHRLAEAWFNGRTRWAAKAPSLGGLRDIQVYRYEFQGAPPAGLGF